MFVLQFNFYLLRQIVLLMLVIIFICIFDVDDLDKSDIFHVHNTFKWHSTNKYFMSYADPNNENGSFFVSSLCKIQQNLRFSPWNTNVSQQRTVFLNLIAWILDLTTTWFVKSHGTIEALRVKNVFSKQKQKIRWWHQFIVKCWCCDHFVLIILRRLPCGVWGEHFFCVFSENV